MLPLNLLCLFLEKRFYKQNQNKCHSLINSTGPGGNEMIKYSVFLVLAVLITPGYVVCNSEPAIPLHRLRCEADKSYFYTTKLSEINEFEKNGYNDEGIIGQVYKTRIPGSVPLVSLYNPFENNYFYTAHPKKTWEPLTTRSYSRYSYKGVVGYVFKNTAKGHIPLYRLKNGLQKNHFYTTYDSEYKKYRVLKDYEDEGIECYILPRPSD